MSVFRSYWRCDSEGETFTIDLRPTGVPGTAFPDDLVLSEVPCPICGRAMRRVVSPGNLNDWDSQFRDPAA